jgi:hypothetical protein
MKLTRDRHKSIDGRIALLALIGLVFLGSADVARGQGNPVPTITTINPSSALAGGPSFTLTVSGSGFVPVDGAVGSIVRWNNANRTTSFVSSTQLTAMIPATDIAAAGTASVTVFNPAPGGGASNSVTFTINNLAPQITSINPVSANAGGPGFDLTVVGSGFFSGSVVRWNGAPRPTTLVTGAAPTLRAAIPASDIATAGAATVTVFNPAPGGGTSNGVSFTVIGSPLPRITSLDPASAVAGGPGFTLTVNGSGFVLTNSTPGSVVRWNNSNRTTTYVSATRLTALITAADIATAGTASVTVFNAAPGGGISNAVSFAITPVNPVPTITSLNPATVTAGSAPFTLLVTGTNFVNGSVVRWNGADRPTMFVSSTQLSASISAPDVATAGTASVTVFNPAPGGGTSNAVNFVIAPANPVPTITSLNPASITAGSAAFTLSVTGTNFVTGSVVRWNGTNRSTTFVSNTQLSASISTPDVATAGTASVTVFNPAPGGGTSNAVNFVVGPAPTNPVPTITSLDPATATAGSPTFTLAVIGTNFVSGSLVRWNAENRPTTFVSSTQLTAAISALDIATTGTATVTVFNPAPGGGSSNAVSFTIVATNPTPTITGLNPSSATVGSLAFTLAVTGTNFVSGSMVRWNGANRTTTFIGGTQLTAAIPASDLTTAGTASVTVFNPAPGGGVSNAQNFNVAPLPQVTIGGVGDNLQPRDQPTVNLTLPVAPGTVLNGQLRLTFTPDAVNPIDDPAIQFIVTGTRVLNFIFPADGTLAVFPSPGAIFQAGTVAGTINLSVFFEGVLNASRDITVRRQAPVIMSSRIAAQTASSFDVVIVGLSNSRALNQGDFRFSARGGGNLATTQVTVNLAGDANTWYQGEASRPFGSQFTLTVSFTVQGSISAIGSVSVTLSNGEGTSAPSSASF